MFSFHLPRWASLPVSLPGGQQLLLVHAGDGRFLTQIPPFAMAGVAPEPQAEQVDLPVEWDGTTLPGHQQAHVAVFGFAPGTALQSLTAAAEAGDAYAADVLASMQEAEEVVAQANAPAPEQSALIDANGQPLGAPPALLLPPGASS